MSQSNAAPAVSVVTPLYNSSPYIRATLDSLLAQTAGGWESILVDDGSTDDTPRVVEPYLADRRFTYTRQRNQGIAGARNVGIRAARGEWVCLLDHDDRWTAGKLAAQLAFVARARLDICGTDAVVVRGAARSLYSEMFPRELVGSLGRAAAGGDNDVDLFALLVAGNFICASSVMIRRSLFARFGLLDPRAAAADDYEMWLRCAARGARVGYLHEPLIEYHLHGENYSSDRPRMVEKEVYALRKTRAALPRSRRGHRALLARRASVLSRMTARAYLDEYYAALSRGRLAEALPSLRGALRLAPSEVLRPRRLAAAIGRGAMAGIRSGRARG